MNVLAWFGLYFLVGLVAVGVLDTLTGRVRNRLRDSAADTQLIMLKAMTPLGTRTSRIVTLIALWVWWPFAIGSALFGLIHKEAHDNKK
jgi:predicted MFS family arabinose efflux permease